MSYSCERRKESITTPERLRQHSPPPSVRVRTEYSGEIQDVIQHEEHHQDQVTAQGHQRQLHAGGHGHRTRPEEFTFCSGRSSATGGAKPKAAVCRTARPPGRRWRRRRRRYRFHDDQAGAKDGEEGEDAVEPSATDHPAPDGWQRWPRQAVRFDSIPAQPLTLFFSGL
jgi:hypothetical protein